MFASDGETTSLISLSTHLHLKRKTIRKVPRLCSSVLRLISCHIEHLAPIISRSDQPSEQHKLQEALVNTTHVVGRGGQCQRDEEILALALYRLNLLFKLKTTQMYRFTTDVKVAKDDRPSLPITPRSIPGKTIQNTRVEVVMLRPRNSESRTFVRYIGILMIQKPRYNHQCTI